jgi:predicted nucleic acid-binding protein
MNRIVVSDTTAITHLSKIHALFILRRLYHEILIPEAVYNELCQAKRTQPGALQLMNSPWIKVIPITNKKIAAKLKQRLDLGESEAITLAIETSADVLIIDEIAGRRAAKKLVNKIIGTVGVLLEAKKMGFISYVKPYLTQLRNTGFRISSELFELALSQAGESSIQSISGKK